jgi:hypothetical protein
MFGRRTRAPATARGGLFSRRARPVAAPRAGGGVLGGNRHAHTETAVAVAPRRGLGRLFHRRPRTVAVPVRRKRFFGLFCKSTPQGCPDIQRVSDGSRVSE